MGQYSSLYSSPSVRLSLSHHGSFDSMKNKEGYIFITKYCGLFIPYGYTTWHLNPSDILEYSDCYHRPGWWVTRYSSIFTSDVSFKVLDQLENHTPVWICFEMELFSVSYLNNRQRHNDQLQQCYSSSSSSSYCNINSSDATEDRETREACFGRNSESPDIGLAVTVFANGPGDLGSIPGRVIPKNLKMELDTTLLNTQHYKVRFKGKVEQSRERSSALPDTFV